MKEESMVRANELVSKMEAHRIRLDILIRCEKIEILGKKDIRGVVDRFAISRAGVNDNGVNYLDLFLNECANRIVNEIDNYENELDNL